MRVPMFRVWKMIVDANLVVYWFVPTNFSDPARRLLLRTDLIAPAAIEVEIASSLIKYVRGNLISAEQMRRAMLENRNAISEFVADRQLLDAAIDVSLAHRHPVYDCLYLALALERSEALATADRRLATLATTLGIETLLIEPTAA